MRVESTLRLCAVTSLALLIATGCAAPTPHWLGQMIAEAEASAVTNPPSQIVRGRYRGGEVFYRAPYCCDVPGTVYTSTGAVLCTADGGFTGHGDGRCADFWATLEDCSTVWRDARAKTTTRDVCTQTNIDQLPTE